MRHLKPTLLALGMISLTACTESDGLRFALSEDKTSDRGYNAHHESTLKAGIWVDPNGCDHWIIDDGLEGYLSARLARDGKPVCSGIAAPTQTIGDFKGGSNFPDIN